MSKEVRILRFDELEKLLNLYKRLHPEDPEVDADELSKQWQDIVNDPNLFYLGIEKNGILVSSCTLAIIKNLTRGARPYGIIENVISHNEFRNKGYGTKVLNEAVKISKDRNCYKVMLLTGSKLESTLKFYENAGFVRGVKTGFIKVL